MAQAAAQSVLPLVPKSVVAHCVSSPLGAVIDRCAALMTAVAVDAGRRHRFSAHGTPVESPAIHWPSVHVYFTPESSPFKVQTAVHWAPATAPLRLVMTNI